ncbi:MAG: DUF4199 domain-containing protein [Bacteroidota bacterium]
MEENQPKPSRYSLIFGALAGVTGIAFSLMLYSMDMHYEQGFAIQAVQFSILAVFVVIAIMQFKKANSGYLSMVQALKIGPGVAVISFIIGMLYFSVFSNVIEPDFMANSYELGKEKALQDNPQLTTEQLDQMIGFQKKFFWVIMAVFMLMSVIFALIVAAISGAIMKKQRPAY